MSNSKVNNNIISYLKIYFERNNKSNNTISTFGNVFKNSKWSDFKTQNIKKSFSKQWFFLILSVIFPVTLLWYFKYLPLLNILIIFHLVKQMVCDLIYDLYTLLLYIILSFSITSPWTKNNFKNPVPLNQLSNNQSQIFFKNSKLNNSFWDTNVLYVLKTKKSFNFTNFVNQTDEILKKKSINYNLSLNSNSSLSYNMTDFNNTQFVLSSNLNSQFNNVNFINSQNQNVSSLKNFFTKYAFLNESLTNQSLNLIKQYRWLTKNYLNSSQLNKNSNNLTQSKSLISDPLNDINILDRNVWLANNINNLSSNFLSSSNISQSTDLLKNYNFYENSRFFTNMRYYYLLNFTSLTPTLVTSSSEVVNPKVINFFNQTHNTELIDFNFNNLLINPEKLKINNVLKTFSQVSSQSVHVQLPVNELLTNHTLESFNFINSNTLNSNNTWSFNNLREEVIYKS